jgi:hypothetical protein
MDTLRRLDDRLLGDVVAGLAFGVLVAVLGWLLRRRLVAATARLRRLPGVRGAFAPTAPSPGPA